MMAEGRNEEAKGMRHRNCTLKMIDTPDWDTIDWAEVDDTRNLAKIVLSRVIEKLYVVRIQEPAVLVGVEEEVQWIQRELMGARVKYSYAPEELMDVAYDFEDVIDDLILRSAAKQRGIGNWERCLLSIRIHKKLELIKSKIPSLPHLPIATGSSYDNYIEEMVWSDIFLIQGRSVAITIVSPVEEKVSALLALEAIHPYTKKKVMRALDKFRSLNDFLTGLQSVELDDCGMVWMEELSHVALSAAIAIEDLINKEEQFTKRSWMRPSRGFLSAFGKLKSEDKLSVEMDKIYAKIQNLSMHRPTEFSRQCQSRDTKSTMPIPPQPTAQEPDLASFSDDVHAMITRLLTDDKRFRVIPIMGMEGIGKTTLAKLIFNHKAVVDHFPFAVWTSDGCRLHLRNKENLMEFDLDQLGDLWSYDEERHPLKPFLIDNRSLVVLDDPHFLYEVLMVLPDTSNGSRMILTTCDMRLPSKLERKSDPHPLRLRTDEESWALFTHALKVSIPPELLKLKEEIVKRCGGLPLLIVKFAEALSHKDATIEEWSTALLQCHHDQQQLWSNTLCNIHKDLSLYMRRCLFHFTLFPQDFDIPARRLIRLWVAEDLVQPEGENEAPEDVAERCLNLFIAQGMIQVTKKKFNGKVKAIRLPDTLRQYWLSKAQQATFLGVHTNTRSEMSLGTNKIRRLVDHLDREDISFGHIHGDYNTTTSLTPFYEDVLSFLSFDTRKESKPGEEVGNFLHRCVSRGCFLVLLVLDLENVFRPKLPEAVGELTRLRYLGLRSTFLEIIPSSLSKLQNVQTLDMKHTSISTLPNSIWKLQKLRHLYLSESYRSKLMLRHGTNSLTTLQTLCGLFIDEETLVRDCLDRLLDIKKLGLTMSSKQEAVSLSLQAVADWISKLNQLHSLRLKSIDKSNQPWDLELKPLVGHVNLSCIYLLGRLRNPSIISQFPYSLIDLTLSGSGLAEDPMQSLDKLPNLRSLKLFAKSYLGKNMLCSLGGFPQLRALKLWKLEQLEEWNVDKGALQDLRDLEIRFCRSLKMLPVELLHRTLLKIEVIPAQ